jgi:hypothetical protein
LTALTQANIIVGTSEALAAYFGSKGDNYLKRTIQMLRRHLPENCILQWDVIGGHPPLETALGQVYDIGNYRQVETETKRNMSLTMEAIRQKYNGVPMRVIV